jgi:hypothetical protein
MLLRYFSDLEARKRLNKTEERRAAYFVLSAMYHWGDDMKENTMGGCEAVTYVQKLEEKDHLRDLDRDGRLMLKRVLGKWVAEA